MRMLRLFVLVLVVTGAAFGLAQFADEPGSLVINWLGYEIETSVLVAALAVLTLVVVLLFLWSVLRFVVSRPAVMRQRLQARRRRRGLEALSQGMIAIGAGDRERAQKFAAIAKKTLPDEPLTDVLRGQAAQLRGDRTTARRIFVSMTERPETELFGLHGLFLEAKRVNELEAARQFAERAMRRNPKVSWSVNALFELQCRGGDWNGALKTLTVARDHKQVDREAATRRCAVLLTAQAKEAEGGDVDRARELAIEAHKLAPDLVPAADIAGRLLASQGHAMRASRLIAKSWRLSPHPDLAMAYAHVRPGDSPRERLKRVKTLAQSTPDSVEGPIAVANEAIEARDWGSARAALEPLLADRPTARVCTLMARIEGGESGDAGRVREWLARAVRAPRDPAWTADGAVSDQWAPISPVTGALDAFQWRVPVEMLGPDEEALVIDVGAPEATPAMIGADIAALAGASAAEAPETAAAAAEPAPEPSEAEAERPVVEDAEPVPATDGEATPESIDGVSAEDGPAGVSARADILIPIQQPDDPGPEPLEPEEEPVVIQEGDSPPR